MKIIFVGILSIMFVTSIGFGNDLKSTTPQGEKLEVIKDDPETKKIEVKAMFFHSDFERSQSSLDIDYIARPSCIKKIVVSANSKSDDTNQKKITCSAQVDGHTFTLTALIKVYLQKKREIDPLIPILTPKNMKVYDAYFQVKSKNHEIATQDNSWKSIATDINNKSIVYAVHPDSEDYNICLSGFDQKTGGCINDNWVKNPNRSPVEFVLILKFRDLE